MASATGLGRWKELDAQRNQLMSRLERYASVTIPKILLPENVSQNSESIQHDWQSLGAQAVNHLSNKLMMALFQPGRPFFRLDPSLKLQASLASAQIPDKELRNALVDGETRAVKLLDQKAVRPKLYQVFKHLIVTGNVLLDLSEPEAVRVMGLRRYAVKRSISGRAIELMIAETVQFDELEPDVQAICPGKTGEQRCTHVKWFKRTGNRWALTQWIDDRLLPGKDGSWSADKFPFHILTWDLADEHDYGTGLVEEYSGDFSTLSVLTETEIKSALLASEYRWLADPAGITDVKDFKQSQNGDVLPGRKEDLNLVHMSGSSALGEIRQTAEIVIRRIGQAFLLGSAVTRDAERVTAEEIRLQAGELEASLGGVYSRLAVDLQLPLVSWLLDQLDIEIGGTELVPTIVTGLDALSRSSDGNQLASFLQDLAGLATMPPAALSYLKFSEVLSVLAASRGLNAEKFVKAEEQVQQEQQQAQAALADQQAAEALAKEGAAAAVNPTQGNA